MKIEDAVPSEAKVKQFFSPALPTTLGCPPPPTPRHRDGLSQAERMLWKKLRIFGFKAMVEVSKNNGPIRVDFKRKGDPLCIFINGLKDAPDPVRDSRLEAMGFRILSFPNREVHDNVRAVVKQILQAAAQGSV